jgi:hypothetical protein
MFADERFGYVPRRGENDELGAWQSVGNSSGAALLRGIARPETIA